MGPPFRDRRDAGRQLAERVAALGLGDPIVLALPRGGVPVAAEVARTLDAELEVFVVRKIGMPGHAEFAIGAIAEGGVVVTDPEDLRLYQVSAERFDAIVADETVELERRVRHYRGQRPLPDLNNRDVVVIDDGLATGSSAEAALRALRHRLPRRLVLAVPVAADDSAERLGELAEVVAVVRPINLRAVGQYYADFSQTTDQEVLDLLQA